MSMRKDGRGVIRLHDATDHGGEVISVAHTPSVLGRPVACVDDMVRCPQCKGVYPIVEGDPHCAINGKVDDAFMTSGIANINIRSMHVDAEINIATDSNNTTSELRKILFVQHTGQSYDSIEKNYEHWGELMDTNWSCIHNGTKLKRFLTHFYDPETPVARPTD